MRFIPNNFKLRDQDREWAKKTFKITDEEVDRQLELLTDHEFRRSYTDWNRVFRNWIRKSDELQQLKRDRVYNSTVQVLTDEERAAYQRKWEEDMKRLRVVK